MVARSIYRKFLAIQIPVVVLVAGLGLHLFGQQRVEDATSRFATRIGEQSARIAALVGELSLPDDARAANRLLALLLADRGVVCADLTMTGLETGDVAAPRKVGCRGQTVDDTLVVHLPRGDGDLVLGLSLGEIREARKQWRDFGLALATACALLAGLAASAGFRRVVGRPLARLLSAIRTAERTGQHVTLPNQSQDEIGEVVDAFNAMQQRLEDERRQVVDVKDRLDSLYNETPALLFTLSGEGRIRSASDFWLASAGYTREAIVGRPFSDLLQPCCATRLSLEFLMTLQAGLPVREAPMTLTRGDGGTMEMLFSAVPQTRAARDATAVCVMTDVSLLRAAEKRLRNIALTDPLTGLSNRAGLAEAVRGLALLPPDERADCAVMLIDLDNFKRVNDTHGHEAGDRLLVEIAERIRSCIREGDVAARLGGDEFVIFCRKLGPATANLIAARLVEAITPPVDLGEGVTGRVGASVGVAFAPTREIDSADLLRRADHAMYAAKKSGKGRYAVAPPERRVA